MTPARAEAWGELSPALRDLSEKHREFVRNYVADVVIKPFGAQTRAARSAGYSGKNVVNQAYDLMRDPRIIAAISEESKRLIRVGQPEAVAALFNLVRNPDHKDHGRAVMALVDRIDPTTSHHSVHVTHRTEDPDLAALEELKALRKLGTAREKLLELYGPNGLDRLEMLEAAETAQRAAAAKVIDGHATEVSADEW
jgi:phage terminase small subunit